MQRDLNRPGIGVPFPYWLLVLFLMTLPATSRANDYIYDYNFDGGITITAYSGFGAELTIPETIDGLPVTRIGNGVFQGRGDLTVVSIPTGVTHIGSDAFASCGNLTNVSVPATLTSIESYAFAYCGNLISISIPDGLSHLGAGVFSDCRSLTSISVPGSVSSIGDSAFTYCTSLTNVTLSPGIASIGGYVFIGCTSLTNIFIPNSVSILGFVPFLVCTNLEAITVDPDNLFFSSWDGVLYNKQQTTLLQWPEGKLDAVTIPASVRSVGQAAFNYCRALTNLTIPHGVTNIGPNAFQNSTLTSVIIPGTVTTIGQSAFFNCLNLTNVVLAFGITDIETGAFTYCAGLTSVTIPGSVTNLGYYPFNRCLSLTNLSVAGDNEYYSSVDGILYNKSQTALILCPDGKVGGVQLPSGLVSIDNYAFEECRFVTDVEIPNGVTTIGDRAFGDCTNLCTVTFPGSLTSIGSWAFFRCTSLTNVMIPSSVTNIGAVAFSGCTALTAITVDPHNHKYCSIGGILFNRSQTTLMQCPAGKLGDFTVPSSVSRIGLEAFYQCFGMTGLYFRGNAPRVDSFYPFTGATNVTAYYLPGTMGWGSFLESRPTALWRLPAPVILDVGPNFGVRSNRFGFVVSWASNATVEVQACADLANPSWSPVSTNALTNGWFYFADAQWTNYMNRFYRIRSP